MIKVTTIRKITITLVTMVCIFLEKFSGDFISFAYVFQSNGLTSFVLRIPFFCLIDTILPESYPSD